MCVCVCSVHVCLIHSYKISVLLLSRQQIVEEVVKNSTSFNERTEFSQEKYVKRKQRKYVIIVSVEYVLITILQTCYHSDSIQT